MRHLPRLDVLRGLAIAGVLAYHWLGESATYHLAWHGDWLAWQGASPALLAAYPAVLGMGGVPLFFVLSGYLIHRGGLRSFALGRFAGHRFLRIYPAYAVALTVFWLRAPSAARTPLNGVSHYLLIQNWWDQTFWEINGSFWSLAVEAQFYTLYPLLLWASRRWGMGRCLGFAALVAVVALACGFATTPVDRKAFPTVWHSLGSSWVMWVVGAWLAERHAAADRAAIPYPGWVVVGSLALTVATEVYRPLGVLVVGPLGVAAVLVDRYGRRLGGLNWFERLLAGLGVISYSVYLWHQRIFSSLSSHLNLKGRPFGGEQLVWGGVAVALTLGVALASYLLLERGVPRLCRWWTNRRSLVVDHRSGVATSRLAPARV